jgi:putative PIN family toxin of toxin-antitoxin system
VRYAVIHHTIVLSDYVIDELQTVVARKAANKLGALKEFLLELSYDEVKTPSTHKTSAYPVVRDPKDIPIVAAAGEAQCDYLITGDKDLLDIEDMKTPIIVTPAAFLRMEADDVEQ